MALLLAVPSWAQTITGTMVGTVQDSSGASVPGASLTLVHTGMGTERQAKSDANGDFVFSGLAPGDYRISVQAQGFKVTEKVSIQLTAAERLSVGVLKLEVGSLTDSVTVSSQGTAVQTASSERAGLIASTQVDNLLIRGRNITSLLQLMPGVVDVQENESLIHNWNINAQGNRRNNNNMALDGMSINEIGNNFNSLVLVSMDSIAEVKILLTNYPAEFGRFSGANIQMVTKSGTRQFHGLASYFKRHEQFNAGGYFNNRLGQPKGRYRFNTWNYNVGGPLYVPGKFNRNKDKLFFFFSQEYWPIDIPRPIAQLTVPTETERAGDFSRSVDLNGQLIVVRDPVTRQPLPGNRVPAGQIDTSGLSLLKIFPLPNFLDTSISARRFNYVFQDSMKTPKRADTLKLDYNLSSKNIISTTFVNRFDDQTAATGLPTSGGVNWPQMTKTFSSGGQVLIARYQRIFSPSLINEFSFNYGHRPQMDRYEESDLKRNQRDTVGFTTGQFSPSANPLNLIPNATFGGVTAAANLLIENRFPLSISFDSASFNDTLTKIVGSHTIKAGILFDRVHTNRFEGTAFNGTVDFSRNVNNPLDSGYAYSNAAMGVFSSYQEANTRPLVLYRATNLEWFAQDNWKLTRRLTLDAGVRFHWIPPLYEENNNVSAFFPARFDPKQQVGLIQPRLVAGQRAGVHPVSGVVYPAALIGAIAPGFGDPNNGLVVAKNDASLPRAIAKDSGPLIAPRIGFAYDVFGTGRTALRGGFGVFYNREYLGTSIGSLAVQAPIVVTPVINYGTLANLKNSSGLLFPQNAVGSDGSGIAPLVMNFSFSLQQRIAYGTVLDVGYVGSLGRHLYWRRNLNSIPFGSNFLAQNADPAAPSTPLPQAFLRPYVGFNNLNFAEPGADSSYHSLQVSANRRFARNMEFGLSWTWSKALDYADTDEAVVSSLVSARVWNYGLAAFDRTHVLKFNWLWNLPKLKVRNPVITTAVNGWQVSGISSFSSGQPLGVGYGTVTPVDTTGSSTDGARIVVTGNPVVPKGERTFSRYFNPDMFQLPAKGTIGNSARTLIRGPGINNWDLAIFKNFPIREPIRMQFRCEMYNSFNHTSSAEWMRPRDSTRKASR